MKKVLPMSTLLVLLLVSYSHAQYKNDNKTYKTVYLEELCKELKQHPGYLLLDVRSPGEYADTSQFTNYNIGHLENAINIDIRELPKRVGELDAYKSKPIFIYCSHSQRSRRASTLLAEKGFTQVFNINEGLTGLQVKGNAVVGCAAQLHGTTNRFRLIGPAELISLARQPGNAVLLDVRPDSSYKGISSNEKLNAFGKIKTARPVAGGIDVLEAVKDIPKRKTIVLVDDFGEGSRKVANILADQGYTDIRVLLEGMDKWMATSPADLPEKYDWWISSAPYKVITPSELDTWSASAKDPLIIDIRDTLAFHNQAKEEYLNKGNIRNAVNIPYPLMQESASSWSFSKDRPILVYGFSSQPETFSAAKMLALSGYKKVAVLSGGLFAVRWQAANIRGRIALNNWVVNVPPDGF
ncbi:rhodanese-like domain-containing protein [Flavihumibacter solisilvae]|uniref:rhodanese-like domain-containing protein n=1 Tax=Flavihumibacter solisilvae TaxID=1349421 RepID=UPI00136496D5|nr:rhodanese-like domain-containing protein [Flavihumibacter solisilvae]